MTRIRRSEKFFPQLSCIIVLGLFLISSPSYAQDKIAAVVNNEIITQKDLNDFLNFMRVKLSAEFTDNALLEEKIRSMKLDLLDRLIEDRLIVQEAISEQAVVDPSRVRERLSEIKKRYGSETKFLAALTEQGLTQADIEKKIREELLKYFMVEANVKGKIKVRPAEVTAFYNENPDAFVIPPRREFSLVATEDELLADELVKKVKEGQPFEKAAQEGSIKINKIAVYKKDELRKEVAEVAFSLSSGEVSPPFKVQGNYYVLKLEKILPSRKQTLEETKDRIHDYLFEAKKEEALQSWLQELKNKSYIKIFRD